MMLAVLAATFALAIYLRLHGVGALLAIPLAALLVPAGILFAAFVFPAHAELRAEWPAACGVGLFFGALAATFGYQVAAMLGNREP
ncbi:hypothetical protein [Pseudomonas sp. N040]|uniref:hypothetical protein n=1 Tax=Pseudomonas sp. N040 TaxID=2785325 RepID=UPI0018A2994E|nr:hypothetical protein [Pseudomonas sp. N040]MBF7729158.1 hypothetical protein [Pseudomonas sp. N040]MBW7012798.1 hypothetical protein [Pseudomonas sp. N040]